MKRSVATSSTDQSIRVFAYNSAGAVITGEAYNSAGISASVVVRSAGRILSTTALTLVARSGAGVHTDSAFTEVGSGEYVIDLADSYSATANRQVSVTLTSTAISGGYVISETLDVGVSVELDSASRAAILTQQLIESYAADGAAPTVAQALMMLLQHHQQKSVSGTTVTIKKLDKSTAAGTYTLDDADDPTSITRAT